MKLKEKRKNKNNAHILARTINTTEAWKNYRQIRNEYSKMIKNASNNYTKQSIKECEGDSKAMWRKIKEITNEKQSEVKVIEKDGQMITDEEQIAEELNNYFIDSIVKLNQTIPKQTEPIIKITKQQITEKFKFKEIKQGDIEEVLKNIKTRGDPEMMNKKIIQDAMKIMGNVLVTIINESLKTGEFPDTWKESTIKPLYKIKNSKNIKNIRPINMLPTYEKIIEKLAVEQLQLHINNNRIITRYQSGYRKGHSCETALNLVINKWKGAIDNDNSIICVFLDFRRAFETLDRNILIKKLEEIGMENNEIEWYKSLLNNRTQTTIIGD